MRLKYDFADLEELDLIHEYSMKMLAENGVVFACGSWWNCFKATVSRPTGRSST